MSEVRVLVGTRKGAFLLTADGKRKRWDVSGPLFAGWEVYHLKGSPPDPSLSWKHPRCASRARLSEVKLGSRVHGTQVIPPNPRIRSLALRSKEVATKTEDLIRDSVK